MARVGVRQHLVDEPDLGRSLGADVLARVGELGHVALGHDAGQALEGAQVGDDGDLRLPHREDGVGRSQTDVAGGDEIDAPADAVALHGGDDRLGAVRHGGDGSLEAMHLCPGLAGAGHLRPARARNRAAHGFEVEADTEVRSPRRHHDGADLVVVRHLLHHHGEVGPKVRPHGVPPLGAVEPQGGQVTVALDGEDL